MGVVESVKTLGQLALQVRDNELKIEFQTEILELRGMMLDMQSDHAAMQAELAAFHDKAELSKLLRHDRSAYWKEGDDPPRPYCTGCFDSKGLLVSLAPHGRSGALCPVCKAGYPDVYPKKEKINIVNRQKSRTIPPQLM